MYMYMYSYVYVCVYVCVYVYVHVYVCIHIHMCIHIYIYIYMYYTHYHAARRLHPLHGHGDSSAKRNPLARHFFKPKSVVSDLYAQSAY